MDERLLIQKILEGNEHAFRILVEREIPERFIPYHLCDCKKPKR